MEIYQPAEDSYFFANFLKKYIKKNNVKSYLDIGTGSGILSETMSKFVRIKDILATDINSSAVKFVREKGFNAIKTNLFDDIVGCYDLITFNAPYLPFDSREPKSSQIATTGGIRGDEISVEFLKNARKHLNKGGKILLLVSSLTPINEIKKFGAKVVARKKIFMEELRILEITI